MNEVLLITGQDRRRRYRFLQEPLESVGVTVTVMTRNGWLPKLSPSGSRERRRYDCAVIIAGAGPVFILEHLYWRKIRKIPVFLRLGGDPREARASNLRRSWQQRRFAQYVKTKLELWSECYLIRRCDAIFAVCDQLSNRIRDDFSVKCVWTLPQPTMAKLLEQDFAQLCDNELRLLCIANLNYKEKCDGILRILQLLEGVEVPGMAIVLRIVGGGAYGDRLRKMVASFSCPDAVKVEYWGYQDNVNEHYGWANAFIYASELDWLPNVLLEAKSFGLTVILHDYAPLRDVFPRGGALYFNMKDGSGFEDALRKAFDMSLRETMGQINRCDIESAFSPRAIGQRLREKLITL